MYAFTSLAILAVFAGSVSAQTSSATAPTSTAGLSSCLIGCVGQAASANGCNSFTDLSCVCSSTAFQSAALSCLQANCSASDVTTAEQYEMSECASYTSTAMSSTLASGASSTSSSLASSLSSVSSSLSSVLSSASSRASSVLNSATSPRSSSTSTSSSTSSSSAARKAVGMDGYKPVWLGLGTMMVGAVLGAAMLV